MRAPDVRCTSERCVVVNVDADGFRRLVHKSDAVRESFERMIKRREDENEATGKRALRWSWLSLRGRWRSSS